MISYFSLSLHLYLAVYLSVPNTHCSQHLVVAKPDSYRLPLHARLLHKLNRTACITCPKLRIINEWLASNNCAHEIRRTEWIHSLDNLAVKPHDCVVSVWLLDWRLSFLASLTETEKPRVVQHHKDQKTLFSEVLLTLSASFLNHMYRQLQCV